jgi:predicted 2-oxoglutarate/Fe(II)-dependent dioxygenase YbiX
MKVGDLVRYRQGSLDKVGIITGRRLDGDFWVQFIDDPTSLFACRWRLLELL